MFLSAVDEYIAIAKEKHGYNVEQVDIVTWILCILLDNMLYNCATIDSPKNEFCTKLQNV